LENIPDSYLAPNLDNPLEDHPMQSSQTNLFELDIVQAGHRLPLSDGRELSMIWGIFIIFIVTGY
jgi:hypothetical protein